MAPGAQQVDGRSDLFRNVSGAFRPAISIIAAERLVTVDGAAHTTAFEQADAVQALLRDTIVPATCGK